MASKGASNTTQQASLFRSIDLGNGFVKLTRSGIRDDMSFESMSFPSFATPSQGDASLINSGGLGAVNVVEVCADKIRYRVGPDSMIASSGKASRIPTESFYRSSEYLALFIGALAYMNIPEGVDTIAALGFSLPLTAYKNEELKLDVMKRIKGEHLVPIPGTSQTRKIVVDKICLLPQLVGSLIAVATEEKHLEKVNNGSNLVIDVGYGTLLWLTTQGLKPQIGRSDGSYGGVSSILTVIARSINGDYANDPLILQRIDEALRLGTKPLINGKLVDLTPHMPAAQEMISRNMRELSHSIGRVANIDNIFLVGGGRHLYREAVLKLVNDREVHEYSGNPQLSNLAGSQAHTELLFA